VEELGWLSRKVMKHEFKDFNSMLADTSESEFYISS
jgi:hypothetical protein